MLSKNSQVKRSRIQTSDVRNNMGKKFFYLRYNVEEKLYLKTTKL